MTDAVAFRGVTLGYGSRMVLAGVDITIGPAEFVGLLGANGAGKTTLLRAILGLVVPVSGTLDVFGHPATRGHANIGYVPQVRAAPSARLSGWDVVASAWRGAEWGLPRPGRDGAREVDRALGLVEAGALARRPLAELSGGERQRLLLAQALLGSPKLLLLDEPLLSLDPHRQANVVALVRDLQRTLGLAVLFSAHELNPLLGALDRVLYLGEGQAAIGHVDDVVTGPVLSRLYGAPMDVVRAAGRIFVMAHDHDADARVPEAALARV